MSCALIKRSTVALSLSRSICLRADMATVREVKKALVRRCLLVFCLVLGGPQARIREGRHKDWENEHVEVLKEIKDMKGN